MGSNPNRLKSCTGPFISEAHLSSSSPSRSLSRLATSLFSGHRRRPSTKCESERWSCAAAVQPRRRRRSSCTIPLSHPPFPAPKALAFPSLRSSVGGAARLLPRPCTPLPVNTRIRACGVEFGRSGECPASFFFLDFSFIDWGYVFFLDVKLIF